MLEALRIEAEGGKNEAIKALLLSLGYLLYYGRQDGEVAELMNVLDARGTIEACVVQEKLAAEVTNLL